MIRDAHCEKVPEGIKMFLWQPRGHHAETFWYLPLAPDQFDQAAENLLSAMTEQERRLRDSLQTIWPRIPDKPGWGAG